jgi:hypothetical protein
MPAPFDECACQGNPQQPNRICEGYRLELTTERPDDWTDSHRCPPGDCADLYDSLLEPCPQPGAPHCITLAVIRNYVPGQVLTDESIDNRPRHWLPSTRLLDDLIRCILEKLPAQNLTRIEDINWTHASEYHCREFERRFVGEPGGDNYFEVTFGDEVHVESSPSGDLPPHIFEATALRRHDRHQGGYLELVPGHAWISKCRTRFRLHLDPHYVRHCLLDKAFDLFLTVNCDFVVGRKGRPVDGNLLARLKSNGAYEAAPPTGDGVPGGTFKSWIHVLG